MRIVKPCPKCGEIGEMIKYSNNLGVNSYEYGYDTFKMLEWLSVTCRTCGYQRSEPCADAKPTLPEGV